MQRRVAGLDVLQGGVGARLEEEEDRRLLAVRRSVLRRRERAASAFILGMGVRGCWGESGMVAAHHERRDAKVVKLVDEDSSLRMQQRAQPCHVSAPRCGPHRPLHPCRAPHWPPPSHRQACSLRRRRRRLCRPRRFVRGAIMD